MVVCSPPMMELSRDGDCFVLTLRGGENRFNLTFLEQFNAALSEVEAGAPEVGALVVTGQGKFWSNGIDLEWLSGVGEADARRFTTELNRLLGRVLVFPVPTVAALNGHTFAGGALLALAHDKRVMRQDRGWVCFPEVDIQIPFGTGMHALLRRKLSPGLERDALLGGHRYPADEALAVGLVDAVAPQAEVLAQALALARPLAEKKRGIMTRLKAGLYGSEAQALGYPVPEL